jgi:hypothetical protein
MRASEVTTSPLDHLWEEPAVPGQRQPAGIAASIMLFTASRAVTADGLIVARRAPELLAPPHLSSERAITIRWIWFVPS